jgi:hypothetical protein
LFQPQVNVPGGHSPFTAVISTSAYGMILGANNSIISWGSALEDTRYPSFPQPSAAQVDAGRFGGQTVVQFAGGDEIVVALTDTGDVYQMYLIPLSEDFQPGDKLPDFAKVPQLSGIIDISVGPQLVLASNANGAVWEWNTNGGMYVYSHVHSLASASASRRHSCARTHSQGARIQASLLDIHTRVYL